MISPISNTNVLAALRALARNQLELARILQRLSTGRRINQGADDPAGLIASERLTAEIRSRESESRALARADANAAVADGRIARLSNLFNDLYALVLASSNRAGISDAERSAYQTEVDGTVVDIRRVLGTALPSVLELDLPVDGNLDIGQLLGLARGAAVSVATGGVNDLTSGNFRAARTSLDAALTNIATIRRAIGAYQRNYLMPQVTANAVAMESLIERRSRIVDTNYALATSQLAQAQVLSTAGIRALLTANAVTGSLLDLLR